MRRCFALLLLPVLLLAACDSGTPPVTPPPIIPPETGPPVAVVRPIEDVTVFEDASRFVPLEVVFRQRDGAPLTYSAEVMAGAAVTARISNYGYLALEPAAVGEAVVRVTARDSAGATAADTLTVRVLDACPPPPPDGWGDRVPLDSGVPWAFRGVTRHTYPTRTDSTVNTGDVRFTAQGCQGGKRLYEVRIRRTTDPGTPATYTQTLVDGFDRTLSYYPASFTNPTFARFVPPATPDTVRADVFFSAVQNSFCDNISTNMDGVFVLGRGPVLFTGERPTTHPTYGQGVLRCTIRRTGP